MLEKIQILNARVLKLNCIEKNNVIYEAFLLVSLNVKRFNPKLIEKKTTLKPYIYGMFYANAGDLYLIVVILIIDILFCFQNSHLIYFQF